MSTKFKVIEIKLDDTQIKALNCLLGSILSSFTKELSPKRKSRRIACKCDNKNLAACKMSTKRTVSRKRVAKSPKQISK